MSGVSVCAEASEAARTKPAARNLFEVVDMFEERLQDSSGARARPAVVFDGPCVDRDDNRLVAAAARGDLDGVFDGAKSDHGFALMEPHRHHALAAGRELLHLLERKDKQAPHGGQL